MKLSELTDRLPTFLKNKYLFTIIVFALWLLFFDRTNVIDWIGEMSKIHSLKTEKAYYEKELKTVSTQLEELNTSNESLEKFARENYYFKAEGEEIFLIEK